MFLFLVGLCEKTKRTKKLSIVLISKFFRYKLSFTSRPEKHRFSDKSCQYIIAYEY